MKYYIMYFNRFGEPCQKCVDNEDDVILWLSIYSGEYKDIKIIKGSVISIRTETTFKLEEE